MILYYRPYKNTKLFLYTIEGSTLVWHASIDCKIGDNILLLVEDYIEERELNLKFDKLLAL